MTRHYSSTAAPTTLAAGCTDSATTIQVAATTGFPAADFVLALDYGTAEQELVLVTDVAGTTLTVTRGFDSTTAVAHLLAAEVRHVHAAADFRDAVTHAEATSSVHGVTGALVGATSTQTLTNKTVALGSNTVSGTKAQFNTACTDADFASLAGAETLTNKDLSSGTNTFPATFATDSDVAVVQAEVTAIGADLDALEATVAGLEAAPQAARKTADESVISTTTLQDDNDLTFTVAANATYALEGRLFVTGHSSGNIKLGWSMPASATASGGFGAAVGNLMYEAISNATVNQGLSGGTTTHLPLGFIFVTGATAGTVTLRWAQDSSYAANTTVMKKSYIVVRRIA